MIEINENSNLISFSLESNEDAVEVLRYLAENYSNLGFYLSESDKFFSISKHKFNRVCKRGGRRKKIVNHETRFFEGIPNVNDGLRIYDILEMQKTMTNEEIITKIDMSRRTFYRRLKDMNEKISKYGIDESKDYYF